MFAKCLKYELKATSRVLVPLLACVLALGIILGAVMGVMGIISNSIETDAPPVEENGDAAGDPTIGDIMDGVEDTKDDTVVTVIGVIVGAVFSLLMIGFFIMLIVCSVSVFVLMVRRFYTSFFTDEGYLTFTLPVTVDCHLLTKTLSMIIWSAISAVVTALAVGAFILGIFLISPESFTMSEYDKLTLEAVVSQIFGGYGGTIAFSVIAGVISAISSYFLLFFSISVGCMIAKKHRFLACAGAYLVINGVVSEVIAIAASVASLPFYSMSYNDSMADLYGMTIMLIYTLLYVAQGVGCYFGTRWILKNRINLE